MIRREILTFPHSISNCILVDSKSECLANMDIVERLHQVIHGIVVGCQLGYLAEIVVYSLLGQKSFGNSCSIDLAGLIGLKTCLYIFIKRQDNFLQLRVRSIVVGIRREIKFLTMDIA